MTKLASELSDTVVFLFAGSPPVPIGTGFIIGYPHPSKSGAAIPLVVTARHVVGDHVTLQGRFSTEAGNSTMFVQYDLRALMSSGDYWEHPEDGVDLVVFRSLHFVATKYKVVPLELIAAKETFQTEEIQQTDRVVYPALLVNFVGSARNYPVLRSGSIAMLPDEKVPLTYMVGSRQVTTQQEVILLDATSVPGASGAPVFLSPGPRIKGEALNIGGCRPYLLGVMHGFYPAVPRELIDVQVVRTAQMYAENSGIAIVSPSWRLKEILDLPKLRERIDEICRLEQKTTQT